MTSRKLPVSYKTRLFLLMATERLHARCEYLKIGCARGKGRARMHTRRQVRLTQAASGLLGHFVGLPGMEGVRSRLLTHRASLAQAYAYHAAALGLRVCRWCKSLAAFRIDHAAYVCQPVSASLPCIQLTEERFSVVALCAHVLC